MNYNNKNIVRLPQTISKQDACVQKLAAQGSLFVTNAEDYFIFTKGTVPWSRLVDVVIGRPGYDNYLVDYFYHHRMQASLIDITNAGGNGVRW